MLPQEAEATELCKKLLEAAEASEVIYSIHVHFAKRSGFLLDTN